MERNFEQRESEVKEKKYQAIVVMPYSSGEYRGGKKSKINPNFGLTYESKMATLAAAQAYQEGRAPKIILTGESTVGAPKSPKESNEPQLSTVDFMKELLIAKGVPETAIEIHRNLQNSVEQLGKISELSKPGDEFLVVSLDFHMPRVQIISENKKLKADHIRGEDLLVRRKTLYKKPLEEWENSEGIAKARKIEAVLRPLNRIDTSGILQKLLTKALGTRKPLTDFPRQTKAKT